MGTAISKEEAKKSWWDIKVYDRHAAELGTLPFDQEALFFLDHITCSLLKETLHLPNLYEFTFLSPQSEEQRLMLGRCLLPMSPSLPSLQCHPVDGALILHKGTGFNLPKTHS